MVLDVVPAGGGARCSRFTVAEPLAVVPPPQAAATLCHVDLYVVGLRQIFTVKILDIVGGNFFAVKKISNLLISRNYLWKRSVSR